jgi:hypothetical protein
MTQRDALQQMDAEIHDAFLGAGLAFEGNYRGPGVAFSAPPQAVRGFLDRGVEFVGEFGQVAGRRDEMRLLLEDVTPGKGAHVDVDGERFVLAEKLDQDEGSARYTVREVEIVPEPER